MIERSALAAGTRLRFATDSAHLSLAFEPLDYAGLEPRGAFDLTIAGKLVESLPAITGQRQVSFMAMASGMKVVEVWMPVRIKMRLKSIAIDDGAGFSIPVDTRRRWTTYGSSITFCGETHSPARTWPATVARRLDLNLTCLGCPGQCHIEPMMALMIRDVPAEMISLKLGINVQGGSLAQRTFKPALIGMVSIIREKQPDVPIAVISPIISPSRETTPGRTDLALEIMRAELDDGVSRLIAHGDEHIRYFDGKTLLGESEVRDYLPDGLHPNGDGYELMGEHFIERIFPWFSSQLSH
jgi:lysophospholipase L1-like esterase